ncbi:D-alanyl-D-alanine carboxypeptidase, partial [Xanthomonas citri pv. citri]
GDRNVNDIYIKATGDPTFLHPDYKFQPVLSFLKAQQVLLVINTNWDDAALGSGWSWNDYDAAYMAERSPMPIYGNVVQFKKASHVKVLTRDSVSAFLEVNAAAYPTFFQESISSYSHESQVEPNFSITRDVNQNIFRLKSRHKFLIVPKFHSLQMVFKPQ